MMTRIHKVLGPLSLLLLIEALSYALIKMPSYAFAEKHPCEFTLAVPKTSSPNTAFAVISEEDKNQKQTQSWRPKCQITPKMISGQKGRVIGIIADHSPRYVSFSNEDSPAKQSYLVKNFIQVEMSQAFCGETRLFLHKNYVSQFNNKKCSSWLDSEELVNIVPIPLPPKKTEAVDGSRCKDCKPKPFEELTDMFRKKDVKDWGCYNNKGEYTLIGCPTFADYKREARSVAACKPWPESKDKLRLCQTQCRRKLTQLRRKHSIWKDKNNCQRLERFYKLAPTFAKKRITQFINGKALRDKLSTDHFVKRMVQAGSCIIARETGGTFDPMTLSFAVCDSENPSFLFSQDKKSCGYPNHDDAGMLQITNSTLCDHIDTGNFSSLIKVLRKPKHLNRSEPKKSAKLLKQELARSVPLQLDLLFFTLARKGWGQPLGSNWKALKDYNGSRKYGDHVYSCFKCLTDKNSPLQPSSGVSECLYKAAPSAKGALSCK